MLLEDHSSNLCCVVCGVVTYTALHSGASISKCTFIVKWRKMMPQLAYSMLRSSKIGGLCSLMLMYRIGNGSFRYFWSGRDGTLEKDGWSTGK